jgi:mannose-6-phosphate isomerase-like protein (cupin superfamily)
MYRAESPPTGELFEFVASARTAPDQKFRFRWTLAPGKKGPGEHFHEHETETFEVISGTLRIWIAGEPRDLGPGASVAVPPKTPHRFLNPTDEPVVVAVSLDGTRMEDMFLPVSIAAHGRKPRLRELAKMLVAIREYRPSTPNSRVARAVFAAMIGLFRLFGVKPYPPVHGWDAKAG